MTEAMRSLLDVTMAALAAYGLVFLRIGAMMALLPAFGERMVPARIKLALALAFTAIVAPAVAAHLPATPAGAADLVNILLIETLNGLALGFVLRLFLMAIEMAGGIAAQSGSLSQMFGTGGEPMPAISHLLGMAGLCLALIGGLHVRLAQAMILSYRAMPAGHLPGAALMESWGVAQVSTAFGLAFSLSAPFVIAALLYNVALGFINKAMPGLMVSMIGAPALTAGVLLLLVVSAPLMLTIWVQGFDGFLAHPFLVPR
jgi:flagellar biosynthetic protein FliR